MSRQNNTYNHRQYYTVSRHLSQPTINTNSTTTSV